MHSSVMDTKTWNGDKSYTLGFGFDICDAHKGQWGNVRCVWWDE